MITGSQETALSMSAENAPPLEREDPHTLLASYLDGLVNYLTRLTADRAEAEDVAQESFLRLFRMLQTRPAQGIDIKPYLYTTATNLVRNRERKRKRFVLLQPLLRHWLGRGTAPQPGEDLDLDERQRRLAGALAKLAMTFRVPLVLREIELWSYEEIAVFLGVAEGTVKSRINRGKTKLRELWAKTGQGGVK